MTVIIAGTVDQFTPEYEEMYKQGLRELLSCYTPLCEVAVVVTAVDPAQPHRTLEERGQGRQDNAWRDQPAGALTLTLPNPP